MDALLDEHLLFITSFLDGDSYLALSQATRDLHAKMNEKSFLSAVTDLPFLVVDASFYAYCWSQHFLTRHRLHNPETFYNVLKRTISRGKMTEESRRALEREVVDLMASSHSTNNFYAEDTLEKIQKRLRKTGDPLAFKITNHFRLHRPIIFCFNHPKTDEIKQVKSGNLTYLQKNGVRQPCLCMKAAVRYHRHEIIFHLLENYKDHVDDDFENYLEYELEATTARILFAAFPPKLDNFDIRVAYYAQCATRNDDPEVLKVFYDYLGPRLDVLTFFSFTHECMVKIFSNDYVRCLDSVLKKRKRDRN